MKLKFLMALFALLLTNNLFSQCASTYTINIGGCGYTDEIYWQITNASGGVVISGGAFSTGTFTYTASGVAPNNGPFTFYCQTYGFYNDNCMTFSVSSPCGTHVSGSIGGGTAYGSPTFCCGGGAPEINVLGNSTTIADGDGSPSTADHTDFGSQSVCSGTIVRTFTIQNTGTSNLNISSVNITGAAAADYAVTASPSGTVAAGGSTTFQVTFNPSTAGTRNASIAINNNDADEAVYDFAITGTGTDPEINVQGNATTIADGDATPAAADHTDFGSQSVCAGTIVRTYTVQNTGNSNLTLSSLTITGAAAADYSITTAPAATIAAGGSTTFQVTFNPSATGARNATITIANNDCDEAVYDYAVTGTGTDPEINVQGNATTIADGDATPAAADHTDFGSQLVCSGTIVRTYTIQNTGNSNLTLSSVSITGAAASDYAVTTAPAATIAAGGSTTFQVTFNPSATGARNATITIANNDCDEAVYDYAITGTGAADVTPPTAICQNITVSLNASGNASITPAMVNNGSTDNCSVASMSVSPNTFNCSNVGANTVILTVTDPSGNSATCTATVTVTDNVPPTATCQNYTLVLDATGNGSITTANVDNGSNDNCAIASMTVSPNTFTCAEVGPNTVTLTVTDVNGNTSTCTSTVTVVDNTAPDITCQDITLPLDASGNASIDSSDVIQSGTYTIDQTGTFAPLPVGGTQLFLGDDVTTGSLPIGFSFEFFGNTYTDFTLSSNGFISFDPFVSNGCCQGDFIPSPDGVDNGIYFSWNDLYPPGGGSVFYETVGTAPNRKLVVSYNGIPHFPSSSNDHTGQIILYESSNRIEIHSSVITDDGSLHTMGIENAAGTEAYAVPGRNSSNWTATNDYVAFIPTGGASDSCGIATITVSPSTFDCTNVGPNTVTVTATDANGNVSTCTSTVTVVDNIAPNAICDNITVNLDAMGTVSITPGMVDNGSNDNCGIATRTLDITTFDCTNVGPNTVTLTVTDLNGNVSTCTSTVTVQDLVAPGASCQNITIDLDATGNVSITPADVDNGSSDNCGIASLTLDQTTFDCTNVGLNTVTLTVTDVNGNTSTCTSDVTVHDATAPNAICQNITVTLDASGNASITPAMVDNGSNDNCGIASMTLDNSAFTCANVGANTVTLTVTDVNGNVSTCTSTITVQDNIAPNAICQNVTVNLDATGNATITPAMVDNGSNDNCGIASMTLDNTAFTCANVGANTVTLTVTDVNGNVSTCTSTITVQDNLAPNALCQNLTIALDATGNASITPAMVDNGSNDNCGIASMTLDNTAFTCANVGPNTVTLTVTDVNGDVSTCTSTITVQDNLAPNAICQNINAYLDVTGNVTVTPAQVDNGSNDNCGIASITLDKSSFVCAELGANPVVLTVTDVNGNVSTCNATVTVLDTITPAFTSTQANITVNNVTGVCGKVVTYPTPTFADNCTSAMTQTDGTGLTSGDLFPVGTTTQTYTITDAGGNTQTLTFTITVVDVENPVISNCPANITVNSSASACGNNVNWTMPTVSDNCPGAVMISSHTPGAFFPVGTTTVTYNATDASGNTATCTFTVTVNDNVAPVVPVLATVTGECSATVTAPTTTDNCSGTITGTTTDPLTYTAQGTYTVTWSFIDGNGNTSTANQTVIVDDVTAPVVPVLATVTGECSATVTAPTTTDNCAGTITGTTSNPTTYTAQGTYTVTWTFNDGNGNTSTATETVIVSDVTPPTVVCQNFTVNLSASGNASITAANINNGSTDNCGIASMSVSPNTFDCSNVGANTVTLTVTDINGNSSTCTATVTVQDVTPLVFVTTPSNITVNAIPGFCGRTVNYTLPTYSDNCPATMTQTDGSGYTSGDVFPVGTTTQTYTVTNGSGQTITHTFTITVVDTQFPVIASCPANITVNTSASNCGTNVTWSAPTASDNCPGVVLTTTNAPGSFFPVGVTTVTYTATDNSGNVSTCTFSVTVIDNVAPVVPVLATVTGECSATVTAPTAMDACSGPITGTTSNPTTYTAQGTYTVTWSFTDGNGNTSTANQTVIVDDVTAPVVPVLATVTGECSASVTVPSTTDNCSGTITGTTTDPLTYNTQGTHTVTWSFNDGNGNTSTATQTVIIDDITAPAVPVLADVTGECSATATAPTTTDNCGGTVTGTTTDPLTYTTQGTHVITWTFDDGNGNTATATQNVVINDVTAPTITAAADTLVDANYFGCSALDLVLTAPVTNDNCSVVSVTNDAPNPLPFGSTTVTWTVTDINGNTTTDQQVVTVTSNITATVDTITCDSYIAADGTVYTSSGTYTATILSYLGCDSVITVNLTILNSTTSSITIDACETYTAPDGTVYNNSGVYTAIIPNAAGCDSIITVNLTIHTLNLNVATQQDGTELVAIETGVTYQWFNCSNDSIVVGATNQTFVPTLTADYSVILSDGVCVDTTDCYNISLDVVIPEVISPNGDGKNDVFEIVGIEDYPQNHITIYNRWGQVVFEAQGYMNEWNGTNQSRGAIGTDELPVGTYFYVLDLGPSDDIYVGHVYKGYVYLTR